MTCRALTSIIFVLVASGCGNDRSFGIRNTNPDALITSHADGDEVVEGESVTLVGKATDIDSPEVTAAWFVGGQELCPPTAPDENGASTCEGILGAGDTGGVLSLLLLLLLLIVKIK